MSPTWVYFESIFGQWGEERERGKKRERERESGKREKIGEPPLTHLRPSNRHTRQPPITATSFPSSHPNFTAGRSPTRPDREFFRRGAKSPPTTGHRRFTPFRPLLLCTRHITTLPTKIPAYPPNSTANRPPTRRDRSFFRPPSENLPASISPHSGLRFGHRRSRWIAGCSIYKTPKKSQPTATGRATAGGGCR